MKRNRSRLLNQAGQGTIEYLLILIIAVILILSLLYQFNSAFRAYAEVFFDGYIACLLETGELPGGQGQCAAEMPNFDLSQGKRHLKENLPKPGEGDDSGGGSGADGDEDSKGQRRTSETISSNSSGGRSGSTSMGGGSGRRSGRDGSTRVGADGSEGEEEEGASGSDDFGRSSSSVVARSGREEEGREAVRTEFMSSSEERGKDEKARPKSVKAAENEGGSNLRGAKAPEREPAQLRNRAAPANEEGFSFGGFIRIFLIIILVIIIVVFLGGQLLQFSKSREKGGD